MDYIIKETINKVIDNLFITIKNELKMKKDNMPVIIIIIVTVVGFSRFLHFLECHQSLPRPFKVNITHYIHKLLITCLSTYFLPFTRKQLTFSLSDDSNFTFVRGFPSVTLYRLMFELAP